MSAYDEIGEAGIEAVLRELYDLLFDDVMVGFLFRGKDKEHIVRQQVAFTAAFLGGPQLYTGKAMPEAHRALPLLPGHFDRRHHLLRTVLQRRGVPAAAAEEWLRVDAGLRTAVLRSGESARAEARKPE